jgi:hypothetical protein
MDEGRAFPLPVTQNWAWDTHVAPVGSEYATGGRATFVTIATPDRAAQSRIFARSARECHPDARLVVLALGSDGPPALLEDLYDLVLSAEQLSLGCLADMRFRYSIAELCFALKPWVIRHLLEKFPDEAIYYFDSDIELFTPLAEVEAALARGANLVLTPHILRPAPDQDSEEALLRSGSLNAGFLAVAPSSQGRAFVAWWGERLRTGCTLEGTCGDQKWLELVPSICDGVAILRHPGYNFACWNAHERPLSCLAGAWTSAGHPLRFVHYTKWNLREQDSEQYLARFFRRDYEPFAGIFADYQKKFREEDRFGEPGPRGVYGEVRAPCGKPVPDLVRVAYARHGPTVDGEACEVFARAVSVLNAPSPSRAELPDLPISILYDEIWQRHSELRYRFDVDQVGGRLAYLRWLVEFGVAELAIPAEFAAFARSTLERERARPSEVGDAAPLAPRPIADPGLPGLPAPPDAPDTAIASVEWLPVMKVGPAGERNHAGVRAKPGQAGHLVYGPYVKLGAGDYRVRVRWSAGQPLRPFPRFQPVATIEAVSRNGKTYLAQRQLRIEDYVRPQHDLVFHVAGRASPALPIEVRVWTSGAVPLTLSSITVERIAAPARIAMTG